MAFNKLCVLVEVATVKLDALNERNSNEHIFLKTKQLLNLTRYHLYTMNKEIPNVLLKIKIEENIKLILQSIEFMNRNQVVGTCEDVEGWTKLSKYRYNTSTITFYENTKTIYESMSLKYGMEGKIVGNELIYSVNEGSRLYNLGFIDERTLEECKKVDKKMELFLKDAVLIEETVEEESIVDSGWGGVEMEYMLDKHLGSFVYDNDIIPLDFENIFNDMDSDHVYTMPNGDSDDLVLFTNREFSKYLLELAECPTPFNVRKRRRVEVENSTKMMLDIANNVLVDDWETSFYKFRGSPMFNSLLSVICKQNRKAMFLVELDKGVTLSYSLISEELTLCVPDVFLKTFVSNNADFGVMFITINTSDFSSHANAIVLDKKNKNIVRFEPHGETRCYNTVAVDANFKKWFEEHIPSYTYVPTHAFLSSVGPQSKECSSTKFSPKVDINGRLMEEEGFCLAWCSLWIYLMINRPHENKEYDCGLNALDNDEAALIIRKHAAYLFTQFEKLKVGSVSNNYKT